MLGPLTPARIRWALLAGVFSLILVASCFFRGEVCEPATYHRYEDCAAHSYAYIAFHFLDVHNGLVVAVATVFIAGFTLVLTGVSKRQAEVAPLIERAYVFTKITLAENTGFYPPAADAPEPIIYPLSITFWNHGKTPAILSRWQASVEPRVAEPSKGDVAALAWHIHVRPILGADDGGAEQTSVSISAEQWRQMLDGKLRVLAYGSVEYRDVLGKDRTTGFCMELSTDRFWFQPTTNKALNYSR